MKNCDRGLENVVRGRRPRAAFSRPRKAAWYSQVLRATASLQYSALMLHLFQNVAATSYLSQGIPV